MLDNSAEDKGVVFNTQRFSIHDGPGIRTTIFLKGCPLRCEWCSNPESIRLSPEIITRDIKCIKCGKCIEACPQQAITLIENTRIIHWEKCSYCMKCAEVCPSGAIEAVGRFLTVTEVLDIVGRDAGYYRRTGGGMTISGGEPLVQWQFALKLLRGAKKRGFHTTLDTSGYADWEVLDRMLNYTDLVLFDIKHLNSERHQKATGISNYRILDNLRKMMGKAATMVWLRYPVIPQFNDTDENVEELCRFVLAEASSVEKLSLLPYHKFAETKYVAIGREYPYKGIPLLTDERIKDLKKLVESHGLKVDVGR